MSEKVKTRARDVRGYRRRDSRLTLEAIAAARTGYSRLVSVRQFRESYAHLRASLELIERGEIDGKQTMEDDIDISVDDVRVLTPFQAIDEAIKREAERLVPDPADRQKRTGKQLKTAQKAAFSQQAAADPFQEVREGKAEAHDLSMALGPGAGPVPVTHPPLDDMPDAAAPQERKQEGQQQQQPMDEKDAAEEPAAAAAAAEDAKAEARRQSAAAHAAAAAAAAGSGVGEGHPRIPKYDDLMAVLQKERKPKSKRQQANYRLPRNDRNALTELAQQYEIEKMTAGKPVVPLSKDDAILRVAFYHPHTFAKQQEFLVLASQPLTALRDRIYCLQDKQRGAQAGPNSGFFFIEGRFYDDMRHPDNIRYSTTIINWVMENERYQQPGLGLFDAADMQTTTFDDLSIRLGSHYLYQHHGDCRHVFIFKELRMVNDADVQNVHAYPLRVFQMKSRRRKCRVCDIFPAAYVTYGDKLANENPFFYCEECYRTMHYTPDNKLIYDDFSVFEYEHD